MDLNSYVTKSKAQWFILDAGDYTGPYSDEDIRRQLQLGYLGARNRVWKDGMAEWAALDAVAQFQSEALAAPLGDVEAIPYRARLKRESFIEHSRDSETQLAEIHHDFEAAWITSSNTEAPAIAPSSATKIETSPSFAPLRRRLDFTKAAVGVVIAGATGAAWMLLSHRSFPLVNGVTPTERQALSNSMNKSLRFAGPVGSLIVTGESAESLHIYIATNLDDGSVLKLKLLGEPATLVGTTAADIETSVALKGGFAEVSELRPEGDKQLPTGRYKLIASLADGTILTRKPVSIGDVTSQKYHGDLQIYHGSLNEQAKLELAEILQLADTVDHQLNESLRTFAKAQTSPRALNTWNSFDARWSALQGQLDTMFSQWTPQVLKSSFYHGDLYSSLKEAGNALAKLHAEQSRALKKSDPSSATWSSLQIEKEGGEIRQRLNAIRAKVALIERRETSLDGLPAR